MEITSVRDIAVLALRDEAGNVSAHLDRLLSRGGYSPADRAFARELALGAERMRGALEAILKAYLKQPDRRPPGAVREILQTALYQLVYLGGVPDHAAVDEAVQQTRRFRHKRQSALVNGVLRTVARELSAVEDSQGSFDRDVVPISPRRHRSLGRAVFPDPAGEPGEYLAAAYSLPPVLARRWIERLGSLEAAAEVARHCNTRAPLIVRVNTLKATVAQAAAALADKDVQAIPHANGRSVVLTGAGNVAELAAFRNGLIQPQDPTATAAALAAKPAAGMRVLDFCAAPGTKTTLLAEMMQNKGSIIAQDIAEDKLQRIEDNCRRMGVNIVQTVRADKADLDPRSFDVVLVDVPCSNTGVLSRRPEARWRFDEQHLAELVETQSSLTAAAAECVKDGGRLAYSTCSIEPDECGEVVRRLVQADRRLELIEENLVLPGGADAPAEWHDGGYYAVLHARPGDSGNG